jgi:superfamily II DNA or RNA helicase/HKD family nuclease
MESISDRIRQSADTALIDFNHRSDEQYRPKLLFNDRSKGMKVLTSIENGLNACTDFFFSVAFVTMSGLECLLQTLDDARGRGVKGRIITTDYLNFSEPKALRKLLEFSNIDVKVFKSDKDGFHTKGYIFRTEQQTTMIVGSANLTANALTTNKEWNVKLSSADNGELLKTISGEFDQMWNDTVQCIPLTESWISSYETNYEKTSAERKREIFSEERNGVVVPNRMQEAALANLKKLRSEGKTKALLISATGTGKTFLSAFDVKDFGAKKVLYLVHREQILNKSMESFSKVISQTLTVGKLTGGSKQYDSDVLFATVQTMHSDAVYKRFKNDYFDYIICDESHRSFAKSYQFIFEYFHPKFLLGMTATPERTDAGDIFALFDNNIAYEIRLQQAMEEDMLCPFHYFGITDIRVNGQLLSDDSSFNDLTSDERVRHIIEKMRYFSYSGKRVKGLIFCSTVDEAVALSEKLNMSGLRTLALKGDNTQDEREKAIERLEKDDGDGGLDYILTYDIFNEGVDIPKINQVVLLRPTQSAIVFVQQIGRGLRKAENKDFLVVIDFIGNYRNNFLIPIALSGDRSCNKDTVRKYLITGNTVIPGSSTIAFDTITKSRIYDCINRTNIRKLQILKQEYDSLRMRVGHEPMLMDLYDGGSLDPRVLIDYSGSLYSFQKKIGKTESVFSKEEEDILSYVSSMLIDGKRPHELKIIGELLRAGTLYIDRFEEETGFSSESVESSLMLLEGKFLQGVSGSRYSNCALILRSGNEVMQSAIFKKGLADPSFAQYIHDVVECGLKINKDEYSSIDDFGFEIGKRYSRRDVCRLLNWGSDVGSTMYGYMVNKKMNECPIFVTYEKRKDISESTKYEEKFIDRQVFSWKSRPNRSLASEEIKQIVDNKNTLVNLFFFVKKSDDEGTDFYYLGQVDSIKDEATDGKNQNGDPIVTVPLKLRTPVKNDLYEYLTSEAVSDETTTSGPTVSEPEE